MSNQLFTLKFNKPGGKVVIVELPLSTWTIINTNTLSISGDTVTQTGVGGWQEEMYKAFSVPTTGSYTITYDYDIESGYVGDWAYYGFGLFLSPNNPNVYDHYQFYANSNNRVGTVIANPSTSISGMKGTVSFTATLTGNTTYYLWYPGGALGDGTTYHLTFKNIDICNNPIQYLDGDAVPLRYTARMLSYNYIEPATRVAFTKGTCSKQTLSLNGRNYRVQFMVLPTDADNTQLGTCNNGISTSSGVGVFWVTNYTIASDGALSVTGYKAAYNSTSCSSSSGWPSASSSSLYYYGSQTFGGVTTEAHKFALNVPSDAVAVLLAYKNQTEEYLTCNTIATGKTYSSIADATCGFVRSQSYVDTIFGLAANTTASYDFSASLMYYPLQTNRTILCGSRVYLQSL